MVKRKIIKINEEECDGCGFCIPNCPEGALQVIDEKARLIGDLYCDGFGACIGHCPKGAITIEEREAEEYDELKVIKNMVKHGKNTIIAHLKHLKDHNSTEHYETAIQFLKENKIEIPNLAGEKIEKSFECGPGASIIESEEGTTSNCNDDQISSLRQWPVQLKLLSVKAPFFNKSHLLVAADCVPFAHPDFHSKLLRGKSLLVGCPKLDDLDYYKEKFSEIFETNDFKSVTVAMMEVQCCLSMYSAVEQAIKNSGKDIPLIKEIITISGRIQ